MYDPQTRSLIQAAPPLRGLDLESLPEIMTKAYASIVSFRVRVQEAENTVPAELRSEIAQFRRMANTYEAYVALLPEGEHRVSAAFVAASAHHLVSRAERLRGGVDLGASRLTRNWISPDVSAMLLFLIAGYQADAAEIARQLPAEAQGPIEGALLSALVGLASGRLESVVNLALTPPTWTNEDADEWALQSLWHRILMGVQQLARSLLGQADETEQDALALIQQAKNESVDRLPPFVDAAGELQRRPFVSAFAGPHQLASLLVQAGETLRGQSVHNVDAPPGLEGVWGEHLRNLAVRRPYLWPNHIAAVKRGFLNPGTSAVLSLPTGAGKTTLAELKAAAALASNRKVIYLAPTHALADQVRRDLREAFRNSDVRTSVMVEGQYAEVGEDDLPTVTVMTPERCLTLVGVMREAFHSVGLIIFDECHLLHPKRGRADRRSVDALLCLLNVIDAAPEADVMLMSAMVDNIAELAKWMQDLTGRPCEPIGIGWKPTRQARGCLVFDEAELGALRERLRSAQQTAMQKSRTKARTHAQRPAPSASIRRSLTARPLCFFCLQQTWTKNRDDYTLLPLSEEHVPLTANANWSLTPNKNAVAVQLAARFAALKIKTLVFIQNRDHCEAVAAQTADRLGALPLASPLTAREIALLSVAEEEAGGVDHVLGHYSARAVCHHGLLLVPERHLTESMFCRTDGPHVLAATPTLAQGMNLPAEVVIIAGDDRREQGAGQSTRLEAHELLNAAGRAGRAGHVADGVVLVIPGDVVSIRTKDYRLGQRWFELQSTVFAQTDQCLVLDDPVNYILDLVHSSVDPEETLLSYFASRLPSRGDDSDEPAARFVRRSLTGFRARVAGRTSDFEANLRSLLSFRRRVIASTTPRSWHDEVAGKSGVPASVIRRLDKDVHDLPALPLTTLDWVEWMFGWFSANHDAFACLVDRIALNRVVKEPLPERAPIDSITSALIARARELTIAWMTGESLRELELRLGTETKKLGSCDRAREFVIRRIPEISYALGLLTQVHREFLVTRKAAEPMPLTLAALAPCVREGYADPMLLAVQYAVKEPTSRRGCWRILASLAPRLGTVKPDDSFASVRRLVWEALRSRQGASS